MMTEEETGEEGNYIRHRPGWRAATFTKLIDLLDQSQEKLVVPPQIHHHLLLRSGWC